LEKNNSILVNVNKYDSVLISCFIFLIYRAQYIQNHGLAVVAMLSGIIVDSDGYYMLELFFCVLLSGKYIFYLS